MKTTKYQPEKLHWGNYSKKKNNKKCIDDIIKEVCINEGVTIDDITKKTRIQKISDIRKAIVLMGDRYSNASNKLLAQKLNLSSSMISKIKSGKVKVQLMLRK